MPQAIELRVTAAGGGAVEGVVVKTSGATSGTGFCRPEGTATTCTVPGYGGVYELEISAPPDDRDRGPRAGSHAHRSALK
jgi:hypothetical protein